MTQTDSTERVPSGLQSDTRTQRDTKLSHRPRVLIPTDDVGFAPDLVRAYQEAGCDVVVGKGNFHLCSATFDIVHLQWPEEHVDWRVPDQQDLSRVRRSLEHWRTHSKVVATVHNLFPHGQHDVATYRELYTDTYQAAHLLSYFCSTAREMVEQHYPCTRETPHVNHGPFRFESLRDHETTQQAARKHFGFSDHDFVVLTFGSLRTWQEVTLIRDSYARAQIDNKRLLFAARYFERGGPIRQRVRRLRLWSWLKMQKALVHSDYTPDEDVHLYLNAANAVVVPRVGELASGLVPLALTFGTPCVAPNHGVIPEYLAGTDNPLYTSGDANSLARALETLGDADTDALRTANRARGDTWRWRSIVRQILDVI
jgi:glycosyltransferase involved in cell wall biosynthesis